MDAAFEHCRQTWWGAVVTDSRYPDIWDHNYARVDAGDETLSLQEVETATRPALREAGASHLHVVVLEPDGAPRLLAELEARGDRLSWDVVMTGDAGAHRSPDPSVAVDEVRDPGDEFWGRYRASLSAFPGPPVSDRAAAQLVDAERDVLLGLGKRWFTVREEGLAVSLGSLLVLDGIGYVDHVMTFSHARRRGYASAVTSRIADAARGDGVRELILLAEPQGPLALYESLGFRRTGVLASTLARLPDTRA
jgi:GNAT superfamily N-acetyltransferase